jgi:hypothetical protein
VCEHAWSGSSPSRRGVCTSAKAGSAGSWFGPRRVEGHRSSVEDGGSGHIRVRHALATLARNNWIKEEWVGAGTADPAWREGPEAERLRRRGSTLFLCLGVLRAVTETRRCFGVSSSARSGLGEACYATVCGSVHLRSRCLGGGACHGRDVGLWCGARRGAAGPGRRG